MQMRKISLISFFLSLVTCNSCANITGPDAYKIHDLYKVSIAFLNDDGTTYGTPTSLGSDFPGYCLKYIDKEDLLIICYSNPSSGTRQPGKLIIEPNDKYVPTLISLVAPNELKTNTSVQPNPDATTGLQSYTLEIIIDNNARDGKIKIRFLSTVDIAQTGAAADNTYILSSEYFNQVDTTVTATAFPLIPVASHCNAYKWYEITRCFIENLFKKHEISEYELRELLLVYRSELCRKNEACLAHLGVCCDEESSEESCSSSNESTESECEEVCKTENVVELVTCKLTGEVLYKSASICTLFNVFYDGGNACKDISKIMKTVLALKCSLSVEVVISLLQSIINNNYKHDYITECLNLRSQLNLDVFSSFSLSTVYGSNLDKHDYTTLKTLCYVEEELNSDEECTKTKKKISSKKSSKKIRDEDSESSVVKDKDEKEGSGGKKIAVVVGIVVVVAVCAYAVSYML